MHVNTVQIIMPAVEKKTIGRIDAEPAKPQRLADDLHNRLPVMRFNECLVHRYGSTRPFINGVRGELCCYAATTR